MNRKRIQYLAAALAAAVSITGCSKEKEKEEEPVLVVDLDPAAEEPIQRVITAEGILRAIDQSSVVPKISAPVSKFLVNRGDHVAAGQLLATLESRDLAASVADSKGAYEQAAANYRNVSAATVPDELVKAQSDVQAARQSVDAAKKLLDSREQIFKEGALARRQVDEALVAYTQAKSQYETAVKHLESLEGVARHEEVKVAQAQAESAKGKLDAAQAQLSYAEIRSPISGVVAERPLFAGEMAASGTPLLVVMDVSSVIARVNLPQAQAAFVRVGQAAKIASTDGTAEAAGKVTVVSPAVDPQSTTVEIWVQAANPGEKLRPGSTVRVTLMADTIPKAVVVPTSALLPAQDGTTAVFVVGSDSVAKEHKVHIGARGAEKVQILSGLNPGELVVVEGGVGLSDGAKVKVEKPGDEKEKKEEHEEKGAKHE